MRTLRGQAKIPNSASPTAWKRALQSSKSKKEGMLNMRGADRSVIGAQGGTVYSAKGERARVVATIPEYERRRQKCNRCTRRRSILIGGCESKSLAEGRRGRC